MAKIETKQIPKELHPSGGKLLKIMYDDNEPPKDYIWGKDDEYFVWNGKKWIPYEFELIKNKGCYQKSCGCVSQEEMAVKFEKFKKDVLAAVSRMTKSQEIIDASDIRRQVAELKVLIHQLEEFDNYYTKTEIDSKTSALTDITTALNGSVTALTRRVNGIETNFSDMLSTINKFGEIDFDELITAVDI